MVGVSFKVDKIGKRYVPKVKPLQHGYGSRMAATPVDKEKADVGTLDSGCNKSQEDLLAGATDQLGPSMIKKNSKFTFEKKHHDVGNTDPIPDYEASFALNLFQDGFSLTKPTEKGNIPAAYEVMRRLYPYDRTSESFLTAIDWSQLPGDILNDIPCKYIDGCVVCEIRDFRHSAPQIVNENMTTCSDWSPVVHKVTLRPTTESIVKDIAVMATENWTYQDMLEIESRILKLVQPPLCLETSPDVARQAYISNYNTLKFNHGCLATRRYRTKGAGFDRKIRLAAARALMKADILAKRRHSIPDILDDRGQDVTGAEKTNDLCTENSNGAQNHFSVSGHVSGSSAVQESCRSLHTSAIAAVKLSSLGITTPKTLATSSHLMNTSDSGGGTDTRPIGISVLGKRDGKELLSVRTSESKKLKQDQDKSEKFQLQRTYFQRGEAKELQTDRNQFLVQCKPESQQLPTSQKEKTSEERAQTELKLPSHTQIQNIIPEIQENDHLYHKSEYKYKQEDRRVEVDQSLQYSQQHLQHPFGKLQANSQEWRSIGQPLLQPDPCFERHDLQGDNNKKDELSQRKKVSQNLVQPKSDSKYMQSSAALSSPQLMQPSSPPAAFGTISTNSGDLSVSAAVPLSSPTGSVTMREKPQPSQAMPLTLTTTGMLEQAIPMSQTQAVNVQSSRRRTNSLPKNGVGSVPASLPLNISASMPLPVVNSPSNGAAPTTSAGAKVEQGLVGQGQIKQSLDVLKSLVSCVQSSHGKHIKEQKSEDLPPVNKTPPSWQLLSLALADTSDDYKEPKGQRSLANSLVGGNVNARKTRFLQFTRTEALYPGPNSSVTYHRTRLRLVLCGRGAMIEAVIQIGDDQDDEVPNTGPPYIVLPALANAEVADLFARQFSILLERDGFELVEDQVQPFTPRGNTMNALTSALQSPTGGPTSLGTSLAQLGSPRITGNQNMSTLSDSFTPSLNQLQFPLPNALGGVRLPPQGMPQNRQPPVNYMNHTGTLGSTKPLQQLDAGIPQLAAIQQQQQQQQQLQRPSLLLTANQLAAQLGATSHNPGQLPQMVVNSNHLHQLQLLHMQRKMLLPGGLGNLGNMNNMSSMGIPVSGVQGGIGNMVGGLNGMNNIAGMAGMNNITASIGGMSNLGNIGQLSNIAGMGQSTGVANMINQQIRSGTMNQAHAAALQSKSRMAPGKNCPLGTASPPVRNNVENITSMTATHQLHVPGGINMMSPSSGKGGLIPMQRAAVPGMGPPKVPASSVAAVTGQGYYLNPQQLNSQPLNSQQLSNNKINSPQMNTQQINSQQISPQTLSVGGLGSLVGGPQSPQLSSQTLGSVGSVTSSPMDMQNTNRVGSLTAAAGQGRRVPVPQPHTGQ
ncbi:hypothetical protein O6H91_21G041000 [Diphasiastrum complanatum]|uniref:Uncharacterized protein n=1 Tax=Diphasiastrum complanatum TaxID=34168 RepID=A0ACC2AL22_DIPCM|nr:hypothetical protein O6H91_21G041000 [Diphasiastrum complanatum]